METYPFFQPKILIVDDDPVVQFLHEQIILRSDIDAEVLIFTNGVEALHYLETMSAGLMSCLILLDIHMPVMDGWEFLDELRTKNFSFPIEVAVVSSSPTDAIRERALRNEMVSAFLNKPLKNLDEIRKIFDLQEKKQTDMKK